MTFRRCMTGKGAKMDVYELTYIDNDTRYHCTRINVKGLTWLLDLIIDNGGTLLKVYRIPRRVLEYENNNIQRKT